MSQFKGIKSVIDVYLDGYHKKHKKQNPEYCKAYREAHKEEMKARAKAYYHKNRERILAKIKIETKEKVTQNPEYYKDRYRSLRREVIIAYGGKCRCCGEERYEFLAIHHSMGDGKKHRGELYGGDTIIRRLKREGYPQNIGIEILCHNCHLAKHWYGKCPHENG